jgi:hypothetical protein
MLFTGRKGNANLLEIVKTGVEVFLHSRFISTPVCDREF